MNIYMEKQSVAFLWVRPDYCQAEFVTFFGTNYLHLAVLLTVGTLTLEMGHAPLEIVVSTR